MRDIPKELIFISALLLGLIMLIVFDGGNPNIRWADYFNEMLASFLTALGLRGSGALQSVLHAGATLVGPTSEQQKVTVEKEGNGHDANGTKTSTQDEKRREISESGE